VEGVFLLKLPDIQRIPAPVSLLAVLLFTPLMSCGAPTKSASSVQPGAGGNATERLGSVCLALQNSEGTMVSGLTRFQPAVCADGVAGMQNLASSPTLALKQLDRQTRSIGPEAVDKVIDISATSTVQMGISFVQFAAHVGKAMEEAKRTGGSLFAPAATSNGQFKELVQVETIERRKIDFDSTGKSFAGGFDLRGKALAPKINLSIDVNGKILDDSIAIRFTSLGEKTYKESLVQKISGLVVLVPYANDVIAFLYVDVSAHDLGIGENAMAQQIRQSIASGFQLLFDGLANVKR
jgi:hypothetical protein